MRSMADQKERHHTSETVNPSWSQPEIGWIQDRRKVSKAKFYSIQPDTQPFPASRRSIKDNSRTLKGGNHDTVNKSIRKTHFTD